MTERDPNMPTTAESIEAAKQARVQAMREEEPLLRFFDYAHLKTPLRSVSKEFHDLAYSIVGAIPRSPERTVSLRKLLEAKDAGVRAALDTAQSSG